MQFMRENEVPQGRVFATFKHQLWGELLFLLFWISPFVVLIMMWHEIAPKSWMGWIVLSIFVFVGGIIWLVVFLAMMHGIRAWFLASNWVMKVANDGVYLKFRSFWHFHFPADDLTVVFVGYDEMLSVGKVKVIRWHHSLGGDQSKRAKRWLEFQLNHADSEELRKAVMQELARKAPMIRRSRFRTQHVPVTVPAVGVVRVNWLGKKMLRALEERVEIAEPRCVDTTKEKKEMVAADDQIIELVERGEKIGAIKVVREKYGMGLAEAKKFVEELTGELAKG